MKIGIIETGQPPQSLIGNFGSYVEMFKEFLGTGHDYSCYDAQASQLPETSGKEQAYVITGSPAGVYDQKQWIEDLITFLRTTSPQTRIVGICFGHQVMAAAFGGKVMQSPKGWGVGLHTYTVNKVLPWMDQPAEYITLAASHQDQVVELPQNVQVIASSTFTPYGMLAYTKREALSLQLHPEFNKEFMTALIQNHRGKHYTDEQGENAVKSLEGVNDRQRIKGWIRQFLQHGALGQNSR